MQILLASTLHHTIMGHFVNILVRLLLKSANFICAKYNQNMASIAWEYCKMPILESKAYVIYLRVNNKKKHKQSITVDHLFHKTYNAKQVHCTSLNIMKIPITMPIILLVFVIVQIYFIFLHDSIITLPNEHCFCQFLSF